MKFNRLILTLLLTTAVTGCSHSWYPFLYHPPLSQGNVIDNNVIAMLKPGMNKAQVVNLMGMPILQTPFSADTWYYVYVLRKGGKVAAQKQVTLQFSGDTLVAIK